MNYKTAKGWHTPYKLDYFIQFMGCLLMQISYSELVKYYKKGEPKLSL